MRTAFLPGFAAYVPYVVAAVELDEQAGLRFVARMTDGPDAPLAHGAAVEARFDDVAPGVAIPLFALAGAPIGSAS